MTGMSSTLCGRCYHPMHWHKCGAGADLTGGPCPCLRGKRKSCRHPGTWSWFTPLLRGHTRVWCVGCAKWADEIRAARPRADAMALQRQLDGAS